MSTQNKKSKWGIVALVVCVLVAIGVFAQGRFKPDPPHTEPTTIDIPTLPDPGPVRILNPEYTAIMDKYVGYVDSNGLSMELGHEIIAAEFDEARTLTVEKFGYKDDIIHEWQTTFCFNAKGLSEEQVDAYEKSIKEEMYKLYGDLDFAEVTYNRTPDYFYTNIRLTNLDSSLNVTKAIQTGALKADGGGKLISLKQTLEGYLSSGYVQKYIEP